MNRYDSADMRAAAALALRLPRGGSVLNLCEARSSFMTAFAAAMIADATTVLPPSRAPAAIAAIQRAYPGCQAVADADIAALPTDAIALSGVASASDERPALIGFTSGSTGAPSAHTKYWPALRHSTRLNAQRIRTSVPEHLRAGLLSIVGTVPPEHMYGMELTVLLPLLEGLAIHPARPLLPAAVATALLEIPEPRLLVSTPAHLLAILRSGIELPRVQVTVSATAPLTRQVAQDVERLTSGVVVEMFGSTETCIIAHRETAREMNWTPYPGVHFDSLAEGTRVRAPWFQSPQLLMDLIDTHDDGTYSLRGRSADFVDVAGKRASLADLTAQLLRIPGVIDGVMFQPEHSAGLVRRVAAVAVAPGLTPRALRDALAQLIDPVFLPRPLICVDELPRSATGKLPRSELERLLAHAPTDELPSVRP